jgi:hypothetical protein
MEILMNPLEIVLIVLGIIIIIISCIMVDRSTKPAITGGVQPFSYETDVSEEDKRKLMDKLKELLSELSEEAVVRADDILSKLSNEKIMAVHDFSEQILEKIKRNHEEVVFLYNMLNDKEKDIKATIREIDSSKKNLQDILEATAGSETGQAVNQQKNQAQELLSTADNRIEQMSIFSGDNQDYNPSTNKNSQILALYTQGKSVMDISKLLELGQGEVKLVIDLYKGKK